MSWRVDAANFQPDAFGDALVDQHERNRQAAVGAQHFRQVAVGWIVVVVDIADETDDVEQHIVQVGQLGVDIRRMDSPTDRVGQFGDRRFGLFDIGVRVFMPRDGKCGAKQADGRIDSRHFDGERVVRGGTAIGGHEAIVKRRVGRVCETHRKIGRRPENGGSRASTHPTARGRLPSAATSFWAT